MCIDTKKQLADTFTRCEWNHLLCLLTLAISGIQFVLKEWQKERKETHGKKESQPNRDL